MRIPLLAVAAIAAGSVIASAQTQTDGDGLVPGDYVRLSGGLVSPVHPQGSLRDWGRGQNASLVWENWQPGSGGGTGDIGFGIGLQYSHLPLNEPVFLSDFTTAEGARASSATASGARLLALETSVRFRIPNPVVVPNFTLGFGFLDYQPGSIDYVAPGESGSTTQKHRAGASLSFGGGLDRQLFDRTALFGEAVYTYAFTSLGEGLASPGGVCVSNGCDVLKNTSVGFIRGGLRVRVGR